MRILTIAMAAVSLFVLNACAVTAGKYPIGGQCRSETRLIDPSKDANDWIFSGEISGGGSSNPNESPKNLREYISNRYEVDCNGIYKGTLMQDFSRVNSSAKKQFLVDYFLSQIRLGMGQDERSVKEYRVLEKALHKNIASITRTINPFRVSCGFPIRMASGYIQYYHHDRFLFKGKVGDIDNQNEEGFSYDGSDLSGDGSMFSDLLSAGGTRQWTCKKLR